MWGMWLGSISRARCKRRRKRPKASNVKEQPAKTDNNTVTKQLNPPNQTNVRTHHKTQTNMDAQPQPMDVKHQQNQPQPPQTEPQQPHNQTNQSSHQKPHQKSHQDLRNNPQQHHQDLKGKGRGLQNGDSVISEEDALRLVPKGSGSIDSDDDIRMMEIQTHILRESLSLNDLETLYMWLVVSPKGILVRERPHRFSRIVCKLPGRSQLIGYHVGGKQDNWLRHNKGWSCIWAYSRRLAALSTKVLLEEDMKKKPNDPIHYLHYDRLGHVTPSTTSPRDTDVPPDLALTRKQEFDIDGMIAKAVFNEDLRMLVNAITIARAWGYDNQNREQVLGAAKVFESLLETRSDALEVINEVLPEFEAHLDVYLEKGEAIALPRDIDAGFIQTRGS